MLMPRDTRRLTLQITALPPTIIYSEGRMGWDAAVAWTVHSGDVASAPLPEPGTPLLLAAGLIGSPGFCRRCGAQVD